jgi:hypothetical protein
MKCANPICGFEALYFRSGSLHYINFPDVVRDGLAAAPRKLIWLCRECTTLWSVETWRPPGQQLRRRDLPASRHIPTEALHLDGSVHRGKW